jgi:hypothetical protein
MSQPIESPISPVEDKASSRYEARTKNELVGSLITLVQQIIKSLILAEVTSTDEDLRNETVRIVSALKPKLNKSAINKAVLEGMRLGAEHSGIDEDQDIPIIPTAIAKIVADELMEYLEVINDTALSAITLSRTEDIQTVVAAVKAVQIKAERFVSTLTARAQAEGVVQTAINNGSKLIWVHEQHACLHCLAYTGFVVEPGQSFGIKTYDTKPLNLFSLQLEHPDVDVTGPPLHPYCRCRLRVWNGPDPRDPKDIPRNNNNTTFAEALQREARRAVLRGDSQYDSLNSRLKAADNLLFLGANLPPTVEKRAARAINNKNFSRVGKS